jgi:antitoxin component of RelBE/YafQ-DinJ toxin-antitoxin module
MTDTKTRNINPRPTLNIPLPAELKARFREYCEAHGLAPAKVLRLHIQKLLDEASRKEG